MPVNRKLIEPYKSRVRCSKQEAFEKLVTSFLLGTVRFSSIVDLYKRVCIAAIYFVHRKLYLQKNISSISTWPSETLEQEFKNLLWPDRLYSADSLAQSNGGTLDAFALDSHERQLYHDVFLHLIRNSDLIQICTHDSVFLTDRSRQNLTNTAVILELFCKDYVIEQENLPTTGAVVSTSSRSSEQTQRPNIFLMSDILNFLARYLPHGDLNTRLKFLNKESYSVAYLESMRRSFGQDEQFYKFFPFSATTTYDQLPHPGLSPHEMIPFFERYKLCPNEWLRFKRILVSNFWMTAANDLENIRSGAYDDFYDDDLDIIRGFGFSVHRNSKIWCTSQSHIYAYSACSVSSYLSNCPGANLQSQIYRSHSHHPDFALETCAINLNRTAVVELSTEHYTIFTQAPILDLFSNYDGFAAVMDDGNSSIKWGHTPRGPILPPPQENIPNVQYIYSTMHAFAGVSSDKRALKCWGHPNFGGLAPAIPPGKKIVRIYSTSAAFLVIFDDDSFICWGDPICGGTAPTIPTSVRMCHVCTTQKAFAATLSDGRVISWGDPLFGGVTPTLIPPTGKIRRLTANRTYFAVLVDDEVPQGDAVHIKSRIIWWGSYDLRRCVEKDLSLSVKIGRINRIWANPANDKLIALTADGREVIIMPS